MNDQVSGHCPQSSGLQEGKPYIPQSVTNSPPLYKSDDETFNNLLRLFRYRQLRRARISRDCRHSAISFQATHPKGVSGADLSHQKERNRTDYGGQKDQSDHDREATSIVLLLSQIDQPQLSFATKRQPTAMF